MQHILVPTDFSETAGKALNHALPLAELTGARITLLHVIYHEKIKEALLGLDAIENLSASMDLAPDASRYVPAYDLSAIRSAAQKKLDDVAKVNTPPNVTIDTAIREGRPSIAIVGFATTGHVDLIVMGTHGRGPVGRMYLGSVTDNVIRTADCPVMAVRN
jgi:nucleotide-binding universal stress UspA family protein